MSTFGTRSPSFHGGNGLYLVPSSAIPYVILGSGFGWRPDILKLLSLPISFNSAGPVDQSSGQDSNLHTPPKCIHQWACYRDWRNNDPLKAIMSLPSQKCFSYAALAVALKGPPAFLSPNLGHFSDPSFLVTHRWPRSTGKSQQGWRKYF